MSTVNNRAVKSLYVVNEKLLKTSGTDVLSSWKKLRKTSEGAGVGVWLPPISYVRTRQTASDQVQFLKQEPAYKKEGPDPNKLRSNQQ